MTDRVVSVSALTDYLKALLESDPLLCDLWVEGEVSSRFVSQAGHCYFTLKDDPSQLECVLFNRVAARQRHPLRQGDLVAVHGRMTVYERKGQYQLVADVIQPAGIGLLWLQLEQLRQALEAEGLFDESRKRPVPVPPRSIGVVTSAQGAVWHDIQHVARRRYPFVELVLAPAQVQGERAPESIVRALDALQRIERVDLIIVARGGGSVEDLWCFNDERVVRAIFASRVPVISAIGHETDHTLADDVADLRAPTPTAAAELCLPSVDEIGRGITQLMARAGQATSLALIHRQRVLTLFEHRLQRLSPSLRIEQWRVALDAMRARLRTAKDLRMSTNTLDLRRLHDVLTTLEPHAMLRRGYAFVCKPETGQPVHRAANVSEGDWLRTEFADGHLLTVVEEATIEQTRAPSAEQRPIPRVYEGEHR